MYMTGCNGNHPRKVFVTSGDYGEIEACLNKWEKKQTEKHQGTVHTNLGRSILGMDLSERGGDNCPDCKKERGSIRRFFTNAQNRYPESCGSIHERINRLKERGVTVISGRDARELHEHPETTGKRLHKIYCICPHNRENLHKNLPYEETLSGLIRGILLSAAKCQETGDKFYLVLAQGDSPQKEPYYLGVIYNLMRALKDTGYVPERKTAFLSRNYSKYPGYVHGKTVGEGKTGEGSAAGAANLVQFVFTKGGFSKNAKPYHIEKRTFPKFGDREILVMDTDFYSSDDSDLENSDMEMKKVGRKRGLEPEKQKETDLDLELQETVSVFLGLKIQEGKSIPHILENPESKDTLIRTILNIHKKRLWVKRFLIHIGYENIVSLIPESFQKKQDLEKRRMLEWHLTHFLFEDAHDSFYLGLFEDLDIKANPNGEYTESEKISLAKAAIENFKRTIMEDVPFEL